MMILRGACRKLLPFPVLPIYRHYGYVHVPKKTPPHILGHGSVWRKCFVVHPHTQTIDPLTKYQWLTKSTVIEELPECITYIPQPDEAVLEDFELRARETLAFHIQEDPRIPLRDELVVSLLQSALAGLWLSGSYTPHVVHSSLTYKPVVECYWRRSGENFLCQPSPVYILHTKAPLQLFCEPEFCGGEVAPPLQYKAFHLRLFEHSFDQIVPFGGCKRLSPYRFAHTVFMADWKGRTRDQILAYGLMQLFSQTAAETVQNGYQLDEDLPYPLATQGVITNGRQFTFVCYQLNTLNFRKEAENGRQNVFWASPTMNLYEEIEAGRGLKDFNWECARLLLQLLLHAPEKRQLPLGSATHQRRAKQEKEGSKLPEEAKQEKEGSKPPEEAKQEEEGSKSGDSEEQKSIFQPTH